MATILPPFVQQEYCDHARHQNAVVCVMKGYPLEVRPVALPRPVPSATPLESPVESTVSLASVAPYGRGPAQPYEPRLARGGESPPSASHGERTHHASEQHIPSAPSFIPSPL